MPGIQTHHDRGCSRVPECFPGAQRIGETGIVNNDLRSKRLENLGRLGHEEPNLGVNLCVAEREAERDATTGNAVLESRPEVDRVRWKRGPVARVITGQHLEQQRSIFDGACHRSRVSEGAERAHRPVGNPPERGLHPDRSREGAWNANRSAAVGAERERRHAYGKGRSAPSARTARCSVRVPRVAGDPRQWAVSDALPPELRRGRFANEHGTPFS